MTNRYYLTQDPAFPEGDLWVEMKGTRCGDPELMIRGRNQDGPVTVLKLTFAEACRLQTVLTDKFIKNSTAYFLKSEEDE